MKLLVSILTLFLSVNNFAQKTNVFHNRDFWKTNPTIKTIEAKISEGNDVSALNKNGFDAVTYALLEKVATKTIKYLISKEGNDVNKLTHDGRTYLFWAAYKDNLEIMKFVVEKGAKTDVVDNHGYSVLNFIATTGQLNTKLYEYLFSLNANINTEKNHNGANALLLVAPYVKDFEFINYLIDKGASLKDTDTNGNGIFEYAAKGGYIPFLKSLQNKGVAIGKNTLIFASEGLRRKKNSLETYKALEKMGAPVNVIDKNGNNPLHAIAKYDENLATYAYFKEKGVQLNLKNNEGSSPFLHAARSNKLAIVKLLSETITDINAKDNKGKTALTLAVHKNSVDVVEFLLDNKADVGVLDKKGNSLAFYLIDNFKKKEVFETKLKLLQEKGLQLNKTQHEGNTLLHIATLKNDIALLKRLAKFDMNVNAKNSDGLSALQIAVMKSKNTAIIKYLIEIGANKNEKTDFGETLYDLASENEILKQKNIDISFLK